MIDDKYDGIHGFDRGIAWVQTGGSWCAIDRRGQRAPTLPCQDADPYPQFGTVTFTMRN